MTELGLLPSSIVAGETIKVIVTPPSTADSVVYQFAASTPIEVTVDEESGVWTLTVTSAQTLTFKRGSIRFVGLSTDADDVVTLFDSGYISVSASPMATSTYSAALTLVEAAIADYGSNPNRRFQMGDMSIEYRDLDDLFRLRDYYKREVALDTGTSNYSGGPIRILSRF